MKKVLTVVYEGNETLDITLIEQSIKAIHESAGGRMIKIESIKEPEKTIEAIFPTLSKGGIIRA